jgi:hypothetical protein
MEKNTVKFMKELWSLLLSAQQNASGVPQQFLDEKEAEIHQKKVCFNKKNATLQSPYGWSNIGWYFQLIQIL